MEGTPRNRIVFVPDEKLWNRGASSLSPRGLWLPRLLHGSWFQEVKRVERRPEHTHNVYHICRVEEGKGSMLLGGKTVFLNPGSLALVSPGESHAFECLPDESETYSEVTFEVLDERGAAINLPLHALLSEWSGLSCEPWPAGDILAPAVQEAISELISQIVRGCLEPPSRRAFSVNRALLNLLEVIAKLLGDIKPEVSDPLEMAANIIERTPEGHLSIRTLARQVGLSPNHFIRTFRQRFGLTPLAYHQQIKINTARRLLSQTHYPIKLIAELTGFNDVYYFSRIFNQKTGMPPGAYRKNASKPSSGV